jgi:hypothetical protein
MLIEQRFTEVKIDFQKFEKNIIEVIQKLSTNNSPDNQFVVQIKH